MTAEQAEELGRRAAHAGKGLGVNPFRRGTALYLAWRRGWTLGTPETTKERSRA